MGLELSLARLKALAKFAFGMGLTQVWRGQQLAITVNSSEKACELHGQSILPTS